MKKMVAIVVVLLILLLLTACQAVPNGEIDQAGSNPSSGSSTPPSSSVAPTTQSTVPPASSTPPTSEPATSVPATNTPATNPHYTGGDLEEWEGFTFIFNGHQPTIRFESDLSKLVEEHLYYVDFKTQEIIPVCDEPVVAENVDDFDTDFVYYVKASEPTKIYRTKQNDPKVHTVVYESTFGPVNDITSSDYSITKQEVLQFVADNKYFVVLELETGETTLVMEQYYLRSAFFEYGIHETWDEHNYVFFSGKLGEGEKIKQYLYSRDTGTTELEEDTWSDG